MRGGAVVYDRQPLVIANNGSASSGDVARLAEAVRKAVRDKFLVSLQPEVNYIDTSLTVTVLGSGTSKGVGGGMPLQRMHLAVRERQETPGLSVGAHPWTKHYDRCVSDFRSRPLHVR